jgi:hypothetical protein
MSNFVCFCFIDVSAYQKRKSAFFDVLLKLLFGFNFLDVRLKVARTFSSIKKNERTRMFAGKLDV